MRGKNIKIIYRPINEKYFKDNSFAFIWKLQIIYKIKYNIIFIYNI